MQSVTRIGVIAAFVWNVKGDMCLDLPNGDTTDGNVLEIFDCNGLDSQKFAFDAHGWLLHVPSGKCLDGYDFSDDATLTLIQCYNGDSQKISYDSNTGTIVSSNGRCLEIAAAGAGAGLRWRDCDSSMPQFWTWDYQNSIIYANADVVAPVSIYSTKNGHCWEVPDGAAGDGQVIQLVDCVPSNRQGWIWQDSLLSTGVELRMCLDIPGGDATDGNWLALYLCTGAPQQQWAYDEAGGGIYQPGSNTCVDVDDYDGSGVGHLMVWGCNGADSQLFKMASGSVKAVSV